MSEDAVERATAPARWLLDAGVDGVALTETYALARAVVRDGRALARLVGRRAVRTAASRGRHPRAGGIA